MKFERRDKEPKKDSKKDTVFTPHIPKYLVKELPSRFMPYPNGTVIHYKPYSFGEVIESSESELSREEELKLVISGVECNTIKPEKLGYFDILYLAILRRMSTFESDTIPVRYECPNCEQESVVSVPIASLEFEDISPEVKGFPIGIKIDDKTSLEFNPLTVEGYIYLYRNDLIGKKVPLLSACEINHKYEDAFKIISSTYGKESFIVYEKLEDWLNLDIKPCKVVCNNLIETTDKKSQVCGKETSIYLNDKGVLLLPFRLDVGSIGDRVYFGSRKGS